MNQTHLPPPVTYTSETFAALAGDPLRLDEIACVYIHFEPSQGRGAVNGWQLTVMDGYLKAPRGLAKVMSTHVRILICL